MHVLLWRMLRWLLPLRGLRPRALGHLQLLDRRRMLTFPSANRHHAADLTVPHNLRVLLLHSLLMCSQGHTASSKAIVKRAILKRGHLTIVVAIYPIRILNMLAS